MSDRQSLVDTLRGISKALLALRKSITASGHLDSVTAIDTLLAVAQTETDKHIAVASHNRLCRRHNFPDHCHRTRGKVFPISMLSSRMRCPACGTREVVITVSLPDSVLAAAAKAASSR